MRSGPWPPNHDLSSRLPGVPSLEGLSPAWFGEVMALLASRRDLEERMMSQVIGDVIHGSCGDVETAAFLIALRMKGESASELAAAARVLRQTMVPIDTGRADILDTCGTGGDERSTFNISTATAFVAAAAGVPVVKHGNRAVSSCSGSSDVLSALGVPMPEDQQGIRRCLQSAGLAFCFAPHFHPALRNLTALRKRLRQRTIFNCLGPLANPAGANFQLLGVGHGELLDPMAGALARLGIRHAFVVCGNDGTDEVSLHGPTCVREIRGESIASHSWLPANFGLDPCDLAELQVSGPEQSAAVIRGVLAGNEGPAARVVLANTAVALLAAGKARNLLEGIDRSREAIQSGKAGQVLERLTAMTKAFEQERRR